MVIEKYGITLRRLENGADLELIRQWRNSPSVNQFMFFRDHITTEMQRSWFERINNEHNYYFIMELRGEKIGLINLKDISYEERNAEGGTFIAHETHRMGFAGVQAAVALTDFAFEELGLTHIRAHILPDNKAAISFNKSLGYKLKEPGGDWYELAEEDYYQARKRIIKALAKL